MNPEEIQEITKSRTTPNPRRQPPGQSREGGMEISTPEARHQLPVSSEDSDEIDLLHLGPSRERKEVYSIGWGEKNKAHMHVLTAATRVSTRREPKCIQRSIITGAHRPGETANIRRVKTAREVTGNPKSKRHRSNTYEDDLSQPWTCEERNPFTPQIRHFDFPRTRMPSHVKTYDGSGDPEDHLKLFQSAAKTERVWFDKLLKESIDNYEDLRAAFRENYLQQTKHIKDPVEIHHIKQRNGESTEDFMERYKAKVLDVEGAPECMKISGFMHEITHPELIKHLYKKILRSMDEMYRVTTSFLQGEVAAFSHSRKKAHAPWRQPEEGNKPILKKGFKNKQRSDRKPDRFSLLSKTPKEIFALEKRKFKAPPPMVTPAEKRDPNKYYEFQSDTGHSTDECMQLRKQIDEMIKSGKLSQFIKELKQNDKPKAQKKGETTGKDKPLVILMIHPWERVAKQRVTQSFSPETIISFSSLGEEDGTEGRMIIEAEIGGHFALARNKKPNDPSYHITHRIQWRNHLADRPDIPTSKDSSRVIPMECAMISGPNTQHSVASQVLEEKIKVAIHPEYPEQTIAIGSTLTEKGRKELCALLKQNLDVFAWKPIDMTGVPWHIAEHRLNVREGYLPIGQKKRGQAPERNKEIQEEVEKLVDAGIMKEVHYHSWLSNPVMVKKHDGSWRMCVDFKDLNKACPQDGYPLPEIDWKVEYLYGYHLKCFLDAYKGMPGQHINA
ncbi:reverse transcriptase domain-containing protein [Tanacetum coccineum]